MNRPLVRRTSAGFEWIMKLREARTPNGISLPAFQWAFCSSTGMCGGIVYSVPFQGLVFRSFPEMHEWTFRSVEKLLEKLDEYGWGEPPYIDEVFQGALWTQLQFPVTTPEVAQNLFNKLQKEWATLLCEHLGNKEDDAEEASLALWGKWLADVNLDPTKAPEKKGAEGNEGME